jgi:hypothetical protein
MHNEGAGNSPGCGGFPANLSHPGDGGRKVRAHTTYLLVRFDSAYAALSSGSIGLARAIGVAAGFNHTRVVE